MIKVLIADESRLVRERLSGLVSELGAVELVGESRQASQVLAEVQRLKPDVILLDLGLLDQDGRNVLEEIHNCPNPPLVIMLTAFPYPQARKRYLQAGAAYFFDKSSEFERVLEVIRDLHAAKETGFQKDRS